MKLVKWVEVNGAKIEQSYLEKNVEEAKQLAWQEIGEVKLAQHEHCLICGQTLDRDSKLKIFHSSGRYLDQYCFERFIVQ